jgi:AcrR family transcriptional regulator
MVIFHVQRETADPMSSRRELKKLDARRRIYEAAMRLFREHGYTQVTVQQITETADVAKGSFFNAFPNKDCVLLEYHARFLDEVLAYGEGLRGTSAHTLFKTLFRKLISLVEREGPLFDLLVRQMPQDPELMAREQQATPRTYELYTRFFEAGVASGEVRSELALEAAASMIGDMWYSTLRSWVAQERGFSLRSRMLLKLEILFEGFGVRSSAAS